MKVVIDIINFEHGRSYGYEEYLFNLLSYIQRQRCDLSANDIILVCQSSQSEYLRSRVGDAFSIYTMEGSSYLKRFYNSARIPELLNLTEGDVVLYTCNYMPLWGRKCKKVLVIHDLLFRHSEFCSRRLSFLIFRLQRYLYVPISLRRADRVIAISEFTKNEIIHYYGTPTEKIETIYNYFNFEKYQSHEPLTIACPSKPFFLSICSGEKHKNHETMLRAFNEHCKYIDTDLFVIVGSLYSSAKEYYNTLSSEVRDRIIMLRHISNADINYLYSHAKGYVAASLFEGLGMPVVEALHFNLPTYLSDTEIHREVSFNKAYYFPPNDWMQLANLMQGDSVSANLKEVIEKRYSEQNTSGLYVDLINELGSGIC